MGVLAFVCEPVCMSVCRCLNETDLESDLVNERCKEEVERHYFCFTLSCFIIYFLY